MKAIVYTSNSGFTAQYAKMLGEKLSLPYYSLDDAKGVLARGTEIIYLGWLMAGIVKGYKKAARRYRIKAVCGVGMASSGSQLAEVRKGNSIPDSIVLFTLQGGFDITKLHGIYWFMMNAMSKTVGKKLTEKTDKTAEEADMLDLMQNGGNRVSEEKLHDVLDWCEKNGN